MRNKLHSLIRPIFCTTLPNKRFFCTSNAPQNLRGILLPYSGIYVQLVTDFRQIKWACSVIFNPRHHTIYDASLLPAGEGGGFYISASPHIPVFIFCMFKGIFAKQAFYYFVYILFLRAGFCSDSVKNIGSKKWVISEGFNPFHDLFRNWIFYIQFSFALVYFLSSALSTYLSRLYLCLLIRQSRQVLTTAGDRVDRAFVVFMRLSEDFVSPVVKVSRLSRFVVMFFDENHVDRVDTFSWLSTGFPHHISLWEYIKGAKHRVFNTPGGNIVPSILDTSVDLYADKNTLKNYSRINGGSHPPGKGVLPLCQGETAQQSARWKEEKVMKNGCCNICVSAEDSHCESCTLHEGECENWM